MQFEVTLTGSLPPSLLGCHGDTLVKSRKRHLPHLRTVSVHHLFAPPSKVSLVEVRRRCDVCGRNKNQRGEKRAELLQAGLMGVCRPPNAGIHRTDAAAPQLIHPSSNHPCRQLSSARNHGNQVLLLGCGASGCCHLWSGRRLCRCLSPGEL